MTHNSRLLGSALLFLLVASVTTLRAINSSDSVVDLKATVSDTTPCITLSWTLHKPWPTTISGQTLYRRLKGATIWGTALATLSTTTTGYVDTTALPNVEYEYWLYRTFPATDKGSMTAAIGYISAGVKVPVVQTRGTLLLVVDDTMVAPLATEISQLRDDLTSDGWTVQQITAPRTGTAISTKALIKAAYDADPTNVKMVYLLGRVPVPYSGFLNPDGHGARAFPTDGYYADMNGNWTDTAGFSPANSTGRNDNVAGDGKFDQSYYPSTLELQVGRVDMANMTLAPSSETSETSLLRRYLRKAHDFRFKQGAYAAIPRRTLIREGFSDWLEAFAANGWATAYTCVSPSTTVPTAIDEAPINQWFTYATANSYLTGHVNGSGSSTSFQYGGNSIEFGRKPSKVVFPSGFGSFSDDWDYSNAALRSILAGNATGDSLGLTTYWTGRPHYFTHHLGMGETYGYAIRTSQNANVSGGGSYTPGGSSFGQVHVGLLGDPALRLHMVEPPRNLAATSANSQVTLGWTASTETALQGYHVYRAATSAGPFTRLTSAPQADVTYTDTTASADQSYAYMVRTLKLETSPGGSYYNLSHGSIVTLTVNSGATAAPANPSDLTVGQAPNGSLALTWTDNSNNETAFKVERKSSSGGSYSLAGTTTAATFTDSVSPASGTTYYYRVCAANGAQTSAYSNEAFFEASAGTLDFQTATLKKTSKTVGTALIPVERFGGVTGAVSVTYTTANSSAVSGTHFSGGTGTVSWAAGEGGVKNISIPITNNATPQQARQFRLTLSNATGGAGVGQYNTMAVLIEDPTTTLPAPWSQAVIDNSETTVRDSSPAVQAEGAIGSVTVGGYGLDSSALTSETGQFVSQSRTGDGMLTAYVPTPVPSQTVARFAVMARDTISWQSKIAATVVTGDSAQGAKFITRSGATTSSALTPSATNSLTTPRWIRLIRASDTFTSQVSTDGTAWTTLGSTTVPLAATTNWGLFHISKGPDNTNPFGDYQLAAFQNVSLATLPAPATPTGLSINATTGTTIPLTWTISPFAAGYRLERRSEDGTVVQLPDIIVSSVSGSTASYSDTTAMADTAYQYRIRAYNNTGESAASPWLGAATNAGLITANIIAEADATVRYDSPTTALGSESVVTVEGSDVVTGALTPVAKSWLRFNLSGLPTLLTTDLKLTAVAGRNLVDHFFWGDLFLLSEGSDTWSESTITWNNAPQNNTTTKKLSGTTVPLTNLYLESPDVSPGAVFTCSLAPSTITSNIGANGKITIAFVPYEFANTGGVDFASRENGLQAGPTLEVTYYAPSRPGFLTVTPGTGSNLNLAWNDNSSTETGFEIGRRVANGAWTLLTTLPANTSSFTDTSALPGVIYEYRVRATHVAGNTSWAVASSLLHANGATVNTPVWSADSVTFNEAETESSNSYVPTGFTYSSVPLPFVTGQTLSAFISNTFAGWVGMKFTVGATPIVIRQLGRWVVSGNTAAHTVKLVVAATNTDVPGGSAIVATAGAPVGFKYATLSAPVTLSANTSYYLVSQETYGGDQWNQNDTTLTTSTVATVDNAVYSASGSSYTLRPGASCSYGPMAFTYSIGSGDTLPFTTGHTMNALRNDFTGWLGMKVTIGSSDVFISELGRWVVPGNTGVHTVKLVNATTGTDMATASVTTAGAPTGQFKYAALSSPVTLPANTSYYLLSRETAGGDQWYDFAKVAAGTATGYQAWLLANGLPMDASGAGSATATPASDGLPNLVKYALGLTPSAQGNGGRLGYGQVTDTGDDYLTVTYTRPEPAPAGVTYSVESSADLASWTTTGLVEIGSTVNTGLRTITVRNAIPMTGSSKSFLRLRITQQ